MRLPPGLCPGPHSGLVEKLHVLQTPSGAVPCRKSRPIALLVDPTYSWLSGRTFLVNKRNVAYFNIACPSHSHVYLHLQYLRYWVKLTCLIIRYIYKTNQSVLYKIRHGACTNSCPITVLLPAVGHGHGGPRPPRLPTTFFLFHFGVA